MIWEEPRPPKPPGRPPNPYFIHLAEECRRNPGRWALLGRYASRASASGVLSSFRRGLYKAFPPDEFEMVSRAEKVHVRAKETVDDEV